MRSLAFERLVRSLDAASRACDRWVLSCFMYRTSGAVSKVASAGTVPVLRSMPSGRKEQTVNCAVVTIAGQYSRISSLLGGGRKTLANFVPAQLLCSPGSMRLSTSLSERTLTSPYARQMLPRA